MIADTLELDLLDLDKFDREFARGEFNHLVSEKKKQKLTVVKSKPITHIKEYAPTEVIAFKEIVTCSSCGNATTYLKSWGLKTYLPRSVGISAVTPATTLIFNKLLTAKKFGEPFITNVSYLNCPNCITFSED